MKIINYKTYLFERNLKDSKEAYRAYCEEFVFDQMHVIGDKNKENHVNITFNYRFTNFSFAE